MNEIDFKNWMLKKHINKKVQSDYVSRLKRIEKELQDFDIDEQYYIDKCNYLMTLFSNMGMKELVNLYPYTSLPYGKYYMNTYRLALKKYIQFMTETTVLDIE